MLIARGIAASIGALISDVYGVAQHADELATSRGCSRWRWRSASATSMVAAVIPARNAARVDPVQALQKGKYQVLSAGESRLRAIAGGASRRGLGRAASSIGGSRPVFYAGYVLAIVVALLLSPLLSLALARALRPLLKWLRPVEGALAADSLIQAPRRTSASVAALMLSLALVVAFAGMARASYDSIIDWMETALNPDLFVLPSQNIVDPHDPVPGDDGAGAGGDSRRRARADGARRAHRVPRDAGDDRRGRGREHRARRRAAQPVAGDADDMYRLTAAGEGLMVSDNLAQLQRLKLGEMLELPAPNGVIRLPIVGIVVDYSDQQGTILMDRTLFQRYWHDDSVNVFRVYLKPGAPGARREASASSSRYAGQRQVFVLTNGELKSYILKITDQWFGLTSVQIAVAVLVAILGIVNTLTVSITDRRRELGVLQAVGGLHGADPAHDLDGGAQHRQPRPGAGLRARRGQSVLHPADRAPRHRRHAARLHVSRRRCAGAGADDSRRGVRRGDLAGGVGGARLARGGAGV